MSETSSKLDALLATAKTRKWYWIGGGSVVVAAAVAAGLYFGGVFGFSGRDICTATLQQAKDFGVISPSAELASLSAKSAEGAKNRKSCAAKAGEDAYTLLADLKREDAAHKKCTDLKKQNSCVALYSVTRSDGMTSYQVREIPPGETDEALAANEKQQPQQASDPNAPAGAPAETQAPGGLDTETAVDNGAAQQAPQQAPQQ